jgi:hypothetical protein
MFFLMPQLTGGIGKGKCTEVSDIREQHYEDYQVVCDGGAWICLADRRCTGPNANPLTPIDWRVTRPTPAPITDTITTATNRNRDNSANPLNPAPITGSGNSIHNLLNGLRYAGHELPEFLRSDHFRRREPCNGAGDWILQSQLRYSAACLQAVLRSRAVVPCRHWNFSQ